MTAVATPAHRPSRFRSGGAVHVIERNLLVHRRPWIIVSGFFEPVFYLFAVGVGIGQLVGTLEVGGQEIPYVQFVAPAMLAASAMNGAIFETINVFFKLKYDRVYEGMLCTPVGPRDVAVGEIVFSQMRGGIYAVAFLVVALVFGFLASPWAILALPAALLIGLGFGAMGLSAATFMRSWQDFDLVTIVTLPLFLFSATFYPIDVYPGWLQLVARFSPLYHGTELVRSAMLGTADLTLIGHAAVLLAMAGVGFAVASRRITRLLLT